MLSLFLIAWMAVLAGAIFAVLCMVAKQRRERQLLAWALLGRTVAVERLKEGREKGLGAKRNYEVALELMTLSQRLTDRVHDR